VVAAGCEISCVGTGSARTSALRSRFAVVGVAVSVAVAVAVADAVAAVAVGCDDVAANGFVVEPSSLEACLNSAMIR